MAHQRSVPQPYPTTKQTLRHREGDFSVKSFPDGFKLKSPLIAGQLLVQSLPKGLDES